jgi:hypothetical protein
VKAVTTTVFLLSNGRVWPRDAGVSRIRAKEASRGDVLDAPKTDKLNRFLSGNIK